MQEAYAEERDRWLAREAYVQAVASRRPEMGTPSETTTMTTDIHLPVNEYPAEAITTAAARQVWTYIFAEPWPEGWRVILTNRWAPWEEDLLGYCFLPRRKIKLNWELLNRDFERFGDPDLVLSTLVHEFIHLRDKITDHGPEIRQAFVAAYSRLRGEDVARWLCELEDAWKIFWLGDRVGGPEADEGEPARTRT